MIGRHTERVGAYHDRADSLWSSIQFTYRRELREIGLEPITAHNAMVGREYGRPWREVDYSTLRRIERRRKLQETRLRAIRDRLTLYWSEACCADMNHRAVFHNAAIVEYFR